MAVIGGLEYTSTLRESSLVILTGAAGAGGTGSVSVPAWARRITVTYIDGTQTEANNDVFTITTNIVAGGVTSPAFTPVNGATNVTTGDMFDDVTKTFDSPATNVIIAVATAILPNASTATFAVTFTG